MNSFGARDTLSVLGHSYEIFRLDAVGGAIERLPFSLKILLENLLRSEDGKTVTADDIHALATRDATKAASREIAFSPARVLMQDFTGVPAVVDLAAMREAMNFLGGDPAQINPLQPAELVIDHSVQVDKFGSKQAFTLNGELEYMRNRERYQFLKWGQAAFDNFTVVPPETGIVHQVNLEYLARVVFTQEQDSGLTQAFPDTLVGTDSHTTMINGLGVLGWGVGGIEAEAAMLGQPISMLIPQVVGCKLTGNLREGATATDLVLTVTQLLRAKGVVGKFVEYFGPGLLDLSLADRATLANMSPEYGATCGIFPIDQETLSYLRLTGRSAELVALVEAYAKEQGLFCDHGSEYAVYGDVLEVDLTEIEPSLAGPKRPQDRVSLKEAKTRVLSSLDEILSQKKNAASNTAQVAAAERSDVNIQVNGQQHNLSHGAVVIAAITSCTNTSNPAVMLAAGLVAKKAVACGLTVKPWVKTSLAPGSKVVTDYLKKSRLAESLDLIGFNLVGYGCTTCIGNSGPLLPAVSEGISEGDLVVASVLSGNRNFEGRVHQEVQMNFLVSPPLVVIYALAGRMDFDPISEPIGTNLEGKPIFMRDLWPSQREVQNTISGAVNVEMFRAGYSGVLKGNEQWNKLKAPEDNLFDWDGASTYVRRPPYFVDMALDPEPVVDIKNARILALLGNSVTTDHISPAGAIKEDSPAGKYLSANGVDSRDFNSYGSRRGNHEVMMRGTFANIRLRNQLAPETEGGWTRHQPDNEQMTIYDASVQYRKQGVPLVVLAGTEYGSGSSRDWAAKGPRLLGVRAVIAESYERIHRSNLVGMGILPLQFRKGEGVKKLALTGQESYDIDGLGDGSAKEVTVTAKPENGESIRFTAIVRIDTPQEIIYYRNGGILQYVLRQMVAGA